MVAILVMNCPDANPDRTPSMPKRVLVVGMLLTSALALPCPVAAQLRASAPASVSQTLDGTLITIQYSRPRARGRTMEQVFGKSGQWGKPWTPGANMATTIDVSRDATVGGHPLPRGTYSIWMVPRPAGEWTVILDPRSRRFHSQVLDSLPDQIRFPVRTQEVPTTEALTWSILESSPNTAVIMMQWFTTRVSFDLRGQPSLASLVSAEAAAAYIGRYDVTCNRPSEELCRRINGDSARSIPLIISRVNGRLTGRYALGGQPGPFILAKVGSNAFAYAWYTSAPGDVVTESPDWMTYRFRMVANQATGFDVRNYNDVVLASATRRAPAALADADVIRCHTRRSADGTYRGTCLQFDTEVVGVTLRPPNGAPVWTGAAAVGEAPEQPITVDTRVGGAFQSGREWARVTAVKEDGTSLEFSFSPDIPASPTSVDEEILRSARAYLSNAARWNRLDENSMSAPPAAGFSCPGTVARSMFCSLYLSSLGAAGFYAHFRPAMNAVRDAIATTHPGPLVAPLVAFNNDPATTLGDVQAVLDAALKRLQDQRSGGR